MNTLNLDLGARSYPIFIQAGLLQNNDIWLKYCSKQVLIVTNTTLVNLYGEKLKARLLESGVPQVELCVLPDGEQYKNLEHLNLIFNCLLENAFNRRATIIALGGGVVGDMAGFAAACYQRGIDFIQMPTTLLSQVDSSVGGKTGVNHALGKNMIGAFYQPRCVVIDLDALQTLPERELSAGMAEVIKYGLIYDAEFFSWLESNTADLNSRQLGTLSQAILRSCEIKASVVAEDEKESGLRAILNLGHTFGHAVETHVGYGEWLHGEAVALGMLMACDLSVRLGWLGEDTITRLERLLIDTKLPIESPVAMSPDDYLRHMRLDKKVLDSRIRLVLLRRLGEACVTEDFDARALNLTLERFCR